MHDVANDDRTKAAVCRTFARSAQEYVTSESHARGDDLALLLDWLDPSPSAEALDVATGGGHVARALASRVRRVVACDLTREMLAAARAHLEGAGAADVVYVVADAEDLPFLDGAFDIVTCRIAAHHFPRPDRFVAEAARVLRPGGAFLLIDNVVPEDAGVARFVNVLEKLRDESHVRCASVAEWRAWLADAGLVEERSRRRRKPIDFPSWVRRTATSAAQITEVERHLATASRATRDWLGVAVGEDGVTSFRLEEWMALYRKR